MDLLENIDNVFVFAPHTDDGELGCGGVIARLIEEGKNVHYVAFSTARESLANPEDGDILRVEVKNATAKLGIPNENLHIFGYEVRKLSYVRQDILEEMVRFRREYPMDLVFMPVVHDTHQDHWTVATEGMRAFKNKPLLGYELIWNNIFTSNCFINLQRDHVDAKVNALREYRSQAHRTYMNEEFIYALAKVRGTQIGMEFAECFEVIRWIM
ncbi:MAG: PIG-L family deacetylase [Planctomycetes bacterium]|jgi:LmbE family N-acetylglucosaminyl deacetylase|nr:PIG-L family deacetylase [Planctomycetota bacterium]